jgi:hypothetical protein
MSRRTLLALAIESVVAASFWVPISARTTWWLPVIVLLLAGALLGYGSIETESTRAGRFAATGTIVLLGTFMFLGASWPSIFSVVALAAAPALLFSFAALVRPALLTVEGPLVKYLTAVLVTAGAVLAYTGWRFSTMPHGGG